MKKSFLGLGIAGAGNPERHPDDFYGGEDEGPAASALVRFLRSVEVMPEMWWDPACGMGRIAMALRAASVAPVNATDLHNRGWDGAAVGIDFLQTGQCAPDTAIVTNPPFKDAERFIRHAHMLKVDVAAFLLKSTYFQAAKRLPLWHAWRPRFILPLTWRVDFTGQGSPLMEVSWFVWLRKFAGSGQVCEYVPVAKPETEE